MKIISVLFIKQKIEVKFVLFLSPQTLRRWVGGPKKAKKNAEVILEWFLGKYLSRVDNDLEKAVLAFGDVVKLLF